MNSTIKTKIGKVITSFYISSVNVKKNSVNFLKLLIAKIRRFISSYRKKDGSSSILLIAFCSFSKVSSNYRSIFAIIPVYYRIYYCKANASYFIFFTVTSISLTIFSFSCYTDFLFLKNPTSFQRYVVCILFLFCYASWKAIIPINIATFKILTFLQFSVEILLFNQSLFSKLFTSILDSFELVSFFMFFFFSFLLFFGW